MKSRRANCDDEVPSEGQFDWRAPLNARTGKGQCGRIRENDRISATPYAYFLNSSWFGVISCDKKKKWPTSVVRVSVCLLHTLSPPPVCWAGCLVYWQVTCLSCLVTSPPHIYFYWTSAFSTPCPTHFIAANCYLMLAPLPLFIRTVIRQLQPLNLTSEKRFRAHAGVLSIPDIFGRAGWRKSQNKRDVEPLISHSFDHLCYASSAPRCT